MIMRFITAEPSFRNFWIVSWVVFKGHAMVIVKDTNDKDKKDPVEGVWHATASECKKIGLVKDTYTTYTGTDRDMNQFSSTLQ